MFAEDPTDAQHRVQRRRELYRLMGELPDRSRPITATKIDQRETPDYILEKLRLDLNGIEIVPAYFLRPKADGPYRTILYNHSHGGNYGLGKDEALKGTTYINKPPWGIELTRRGYAVLAIDHWAFGERKGRTESSIFKQMLWEGRVMWGMMVFDSLRAMDYLVTRPDVKKDQIGTLGMSMGSTMAWWAAALDERIKVCVDICCLTDFQALIDTNGLDGHGVYYFVPSLIRHFTTAQINALIAPRPHLGLAGNKDKLTPPEGLDRIDQELKAIYRAHNAADAWKLLRYDVAHVETDQMRAEILAFLKRWLPTTP